ncbi:MAG: SDR family NAD(P)-dependent oxidoreductase [Clostridia bacterium]|nr:SDR family NAD(P)-dependent oxidoreductase [Clostridia bacterium]
MSIEKWIKKNTASLDGKTVAISGSTGGLGRELCIHLGALGASLVLLDRNIAKSKALADELRSMYNGISITHITVDMTDIRAVKAAADKLSEMPIDYLILNAGAYSIPRCTLPCGYDNVFTINFISPYYLARRLLSGIKARGGKVIAVGSIAHNYSKIDENDVDFSTRKKASLVYGNAKRYLTYSLFALADEGGIAVAHPGITFTGITAHYPKLIFAIIKHPMKIIFMSPRRASLCVLRAIFADCKPREWIGPSLFDVWGMPKQKPLKTAKSAEAEKIAEIAEKIYNEINT